MSRVHDHVLPSLRNSLQRADQPQPPGPPHPIGTRERFFSGRTPCQILGILEGGTWIAQKTISNPVRAAWSPDGNTLWAIQHASYGGDLLHYWNGSAWQLPSSQVSVPGSQYVSMAGSGANDIWASGTGTMIHYNGTSWSAVTTPFTSSTTTLDGLVVKSPSLAFARAYPASVIRYDGTAWRVDTAFISGDVHALWSPQGGSVWALGEFGLRVYRAGAWSSVPLPADVVPGTTIWGTSDADVYVDASLTASSTTDLVLHWNGSTWTREQYPTGFFSLLRVAVIGGQRWAWRGSSTSSSSDTTFSVLK